MENRETKRLADKIVAGFKSNPKEIVQWINDNSDNISENLKFELFMRVSALSGFFVS